MTQLKAHVIQLLPTPAQRNYFLRAAGTARFAFNWALDFWNAEYKRHKETCPRDKHSRSRSDGCPRNEEVHQLPSVVGVWKAWNAHKKVELPWAYEVSADVPKWAIYEQLPRAFNNWWNKKTRQGPPKFKSRKTARKSFVANDKCKPIHFSRPGDERGKALKLQKIGWVRCRENLRWPAEQINRVTVFEQAGKWYASVLFEAPDFKPAVHENQEEAVGMDLGSRKLAVAYDGKQFHRFDNPKALEKALRDLRREQRRASRRGVRDKKRRVLKATNGLAKSNRRIARLHKRIADIRRWHQHNLSHILTRDYGLVMTEDLHVKGMMGGRSAKQLADAGLGEILRQIEYKAKWRGGRHMEADRFYPSSKTCSDCGFVNDGIGSRERWACPNCGVIHDRDENAAKNLYNLIAVGGSTPEPTASAP